MFSATLSQMSSMSSLLLLVSERSRRRSVQVSGGSPQEAACAAQAMPRLRYNNIPMTMKTISCQRRSRWTFQAIENFVETTYNNSEDNLPDGLPVDENYDDGKNARDGGKGAEYDAPDGGGLGEDDEASKCSLILAQFIKFSCV
jgi:hypothetical protein